MALLAAGFSFAAVYFAVPAYIDLTYSVKSHPIVTSIFESRAVKSVYYYLKPKLGLGWTGDFSRVKPNANDGLDAAQQAEIEALLALGYADGVSPATTRSGTTFHKQDIAYQGLNLQNDGHGASAVLMDMDGVVLHEWAFPFSKAFPDSLSFDGESGTYHWRRVRLLPDGDLLAIYNQHGLIQLDRDSNLLWTFEDHVHHDIEVLADGSIYVITNQAEVVERINPDRPILHDFIVKLSPDGREIDRISVLEAIEDSDYLPLLDLTPKVGDIMHTNEIEVLDGRLADWNPAFKAGNLLVSIRNFNTVVVIDPVERRVVWTLSNLFSAQHDPRILDNGNMLIFDNKGDTGEVSRVFELDLRNQQITWNYRGSEHDFHSETCGTAQRLPNGNTLITESNFGRAFEVTPERSIVWEYYSPERTGPDDAFIAQIYEIVRIAPDSVPWLDSASAIAGAKGEATLVDRQP